MTVFVCPRGDLGCQERFPTTGELDYHTHLVHGYRGVWRIVSSLRPEQALPVGPNPTRHVPDGLAAGPGTSTMGMRPSATRAATAGKRSGRKHAPAAR